MRKRHMRIPVVFVASIMLALAAMPAASASAASGEGEITRAEANADWTLGSVAGSATWSGCPVVWEPEPPWYEFPPWYEIEPESEWPTPEHCRVQAFVTVGPGTDPSDCSDAGRRQPQYSEQVTIAWSSEETLGWGFADFDVPDVPLSGESGQLACLSLLETYEEEFYCPPETICIAIVGPILVQNYSVLDSAPLVARPPDPPVNTEPPQLSGTPAVGETLICSDGGWEGAESFSHAWLRDGAPIEGQTGTTHVVESADHGHSIACEVTATNEGGSTSVTSNALAVPLPPSIESESVSNVTQTDATLEAQINPNSAERGAIYQFQVVADPSEYLPEFACPTEGFPAGTSLCLTLAAQEGALPIGWTAAATEDQSVGLDLADAGMTLQPGTTYHYRVITAGSVQAEDTIEWEEPIVEGPDRELTTLPPAEEPAAEGESEAPSTDKGVGQGPVTTPTPPSSGSASPPQGPGSKRTGRCHRKRRRSSRHRHPKHERHHEGHGHGPHSRCARVSNARALRG